MTGRRESGIPQHMLPHPPCARLQNMTRLVVFLKDKDGDAEAEAALRSRPKGKQNLDSDDFQSR